MKGKILKTLAIFVLIIFVNQIVWPTVACALTGGPSQPEVQSFEPSGTTEMVDLFTGDFNYNIPLLDVEGYPVNIAYHAGITMDQEASWVGLGWNINPGAITRNMRGLPDEFKGDTIKTEMNMNPQQEFGLDFSAAWELIGLDLETINSIKKGTTNVDTNYFGLNFSLGVIYNNYKGLGYKIGAGIPIHFKGGHNLNLGISPSSQSKFGIDANYSYAFSNLVENCKSSIIKGVGQFVNFGLGVNSSSGLKTFGLNFKYSESMKMRENIWEVGVKGSIVNFAHQTYVPNVSVSMKNFCIGTGFDFGGEATATFAGYGIDGYYSSSWLKKSEKSKSTNSYGYFYIEYSSDDDLLDFNREKDVVYTNGITNLPLTNFTYDVYNITAQGGGGMFRPFRNDVGSVYDPTATNNSSNLAIEDIQLGGGYGFKIGASPSYYYSFTKSGKWDGLSNPASELLAFEKKEMNHLGESIEPAYFKTVGEHAEVDNEYYDELGRENPVCIDVNSFKAKKKYVKEDMYSTSTWPLEPVYNENRAIRNQVISTLTYQEQEALNKSLPLSYHDFSDPDPVLKTFRDDNFRRNHHFAEFTVLQTDGSRYVYGIAAYNTKYEEVSFNASDQNMEYDDETNLKEYDPGVSNSIANSNGLDHLFMKKSIPPYAHSYLLTEVLSADYVDVYGDGVTDDDLGSAVKFNYARYYDPIECPYKWRTPVKKDRADFNKGFHSDNTDDKGNYLYGEKEIWYLASIESKNFIAVFDVSNREDAFGVIDENGGIDESRPLKKLDRISLYSKSDYYANPENAIPIKIVHFEYDYSLCPNVDNNSGDYVDVYGEKIDTTNNNVNANAGKLTLKRIYFSYGNSSKSNLNSYTFNYDNANPSYNMKAYDRWGNYKPFDTDLPNYEYPYVNQDKDSADIYTSAWSLSSINLPSGGSIHIQYESDDYAYVQDKEATQMFKICGIGDSETYSADSALFDNGNNYKNNNTYIYF
jgi:hypothetical protein